VVGIQWSRARAPELPSPPSVLAGSDSDPVIEDPRELPAFDEAFDMVCQQTLTAVDRINAAGPDLMAVAEVEGGSLGERLAAVDASPELFTAADLLSLEHAWRVTADVQAIGEGEAELTVLAGSANLLRSRCQDWQMPL
jgi:hypothetical protein